MMDNLTLAQINDMNANSVRQQTMYHNQQVLGLNRMSSPIEDITRETTSTLKEAGNTLFDTLTNNF